MSVVTSSAALTTLLLGVVALGRGQVSLHFGGLGLPFIATAVIVFALGAVRAVGVLALHDYRGPTTRSLRKAPENYWNDGANVALRMVAETQLTMLEAAKRANGLKADELEDAFRFEVGAAVVLALGAVFDAGGNLMLPAESDRG